MSSVQRFIRQIQPDNTYYSAATLLTNIGGLAFEFQPTASNVVGNYASNASGYMVAATSGLIAAINSAVAHETNVVLRDMGKTVQAPLSSVSGVVGFYRHVQLISANTAALGSFGVLGGSNAPTANTDYLTFYIPIMIAGVAQGSAIVAHSACHM